MISNLLNALAMFPLTLMKYIYQCSLLLICCPPETEIEILQKKIYLLEYTIEDMNWKIQKSNQRMKEYILKHLPQEQYISYDEFSRKIQEINDKYSILEKDLSIFKRNQIKYDNQVMGALRWSTTKKEDGGNYFMEAFHEIGDFLDNTGENMQEF